MPVDEQIKEAAERFWGDSSKKTGLTGRHYLAHARGKEKFSPENLRAVDILFASADSHGGMIGLTFFEVGAYIGEIVRRFYGEKCKWVEAGASDEIELHLPDGKVLSPMNLVKEQIKAYEPEGFVKWGRKAGLKFGGFLKLPQARFRPR